MMLNMIMVNHAFHPSNQPRAFQGRETAVGQRRLGGVHSQREVNRSDSWYGNLPWTIPSRIANHNEKSIGIKRGNWLADKSRTGRTLKIKHHGHMFHINLMSGWLPTEHSDNFTLDPLVGPCRDTDSVTSFLHSVVGSWGFSFYEFQSSSMVRGW